MNNFRCFVNPAVSFACTKGVRKAPAHHAHRAVQSWMQREISFLSASVSTLADGFPRCRRAVERSRESTPHAYLTSGRCHSATHHLSSSCHNRRPVLASRRRTGRSSANQPSGVGRSAESSVVASQNGGSSLVNRRSPTNWKDRSWPNPEVRGQPEQHGAASENRISVADPFPPLRHTRVLRPLSNGQPPSSARGVAAAHSRHSSIDGNMMRLMCARLLLPERI
jgi:hypothetical protein